MTNSRGFLPTPLARIGLIIPSSNRLTEPQLRHFAPLELGVHVTRLQMTGKRNRPLSALGDDIQRAADALADAKCDIIVFHCTGHAMEEGPDGDARTRALIKNATGIEAISTASAIQEALDALQLKRLILLTPYDQDTNDHEIDYIRQIGLTVVHDVALALPGSDQYLAQPPERWVALAVEHARDDADGYFLSCTNTTQIEAIELIERKLGKPVVNSNQAVLWACMKRLWPKLGGAEPAPGLGRLVAGSL
jgi:maleate isomerase